MKNLKALHDSGDLTEVCDARVLEANAVMAAIHFQLGHYREWAGIVDWYTVGEMETVVKKLEEIATILKIKLPGVA